MAARLERLDPARGAVDRHADRPARFQPRWIERDPDPVRDRQRQRLRRRSRRQAQRQDAHADQVRAVDALEGLGSALAAVLLVLVVGLIWILSRIVRLDRVL